MSAYMNYIVFKGKNFTVQKIADKYGLKDVEDFREFLLKLIEKGIIKEEYRDLISTDSMTVTYKSYNEVSDLRFNYYDTVYWNSLGVYFMYEHGGEKQLVSNIELWAVEEYIKEEEEEEK